MIVQEGIFEYYEKPFRLPNVIEVPFLALLVHKINKYWLFQTPFLFNLKLIF